MIDGDFTPGVIDGWVLGTYRECMSSCTGGSLHGSPRVAARWAGNPEPVGIGPVPGTAHFGSPQQDVLWKRPWQAINGIAPRFLAMMFIGRLLSSLAAGQAWGEYNRKMEEVRNQRNDQPNAALMLDMEIRSLPRPRLSYIIANGAEGLVQAYAKDANVAEELAVAHALFAAFSLPLPRMLGGTA